MSFPRAKVQRFNEIQNCTPSPADYNPKIKSHVTGATLSTTDRFSECKSPAVSDNVSMHSLNSTVCFRTPTLSKKKKQATPAIAKVKSTDIFSETNSSGEALNEKIVECNNKDLYIKELTEQIEDMKTQLNKLKLQKDDIEIEKIQFEKLLKEIKDKQKVELENLNVKHVKELLILQKQIEDTRTNLEFATKEYDKLKTENLENKYEEMLMQINEEHKLELENLHLEHCNKQAALKGNISKINNEMVLAKSEWETMRMENRKGMEELLDNIGKFQKLNSMLIETFHEEIRTKEELILKEKEASMKLENELIQLKETHTMETENLKTKHKNEIVEIEYEMLKTITELQNKLDQEKKVLENTYKSKLANLENNHTETITKIKNQSDLQIEQIEEDCRRANQLTEVHFQEKCKDIENEWRIKVETQIKHTEKIIVEYKEINEFNLTQHKVEKEHLTKEAEEKLQEVENKWKTKLEEQIKESEEILKECQAISEYNIIQCELEKNDTKRKLSDAVNDLENEKEISNKYLHQKNDIENLYTRLKLDYDEVITKLEKVQDELAKEKELRQNEVQQMTAEKHTFEVTITKTRKTVEALTKRLFDSDRDVEQLKSELETCEKEKLENEDKCNKLTIELETLKKLYEDMELQSESDLKLAENKIKKLGKELLDKVNHYKLKAEESVTENTLELQEMKEQLHQQQALNSETQKLISKASEELESYEVYNSKLELKILTLTNELEAATKNAAEIERTNKELREQLKDQEGCSNKIEETFSKDMDSKNNEIKSLRKEMNQLQEKADSYYQYCEYYKCQTNKYEKEVEELNVIQKNYIDQSGKYDELLQKYDEVLMKNAELAKTIIQQESLIGPFRDQLEAYEVERAALLDQKHDAENEAKIMGMKYAQILGHQNQKQKIKHLMDLKRKNYDLMESKAEIEQKARLQAKTIEKLKKEIASLTKTPKRQIGDDKENVNSPNRSQNGSYVFSPLRERN